MLITAFSSIIGVLSAPSPEPAKGKRDFATKTGVTNLTIQNVTINKPPVLQPYGRGNGYAATLTAGADKMTVKNLSTNAKMGKGFSCADFGKDNIAVDARGKENVFDNVRVQAMIVAKDAVVTKAVTDCPLKRHE